MVSVFPHGTQQIDCLRVTEPGIDAGETEAYGVAFRSFQADVLFATAHHLKRMPKTVGAAKPLNDENRFFNALAEGRQGFQFFYQRRDVFLPDL